MSLESNDHQDNDIQGTEQSLSTDVAEMLREQPTLRGLNNIRSAVAWEIASLAEEPGSHARKLRTILVETIFGLTEGREDMPIDSETDYAQLLDFYTQQLVLSIIQA